MSVVCAKAGDTSVKHYPIIAFRFCHFIFIKVIKRSTPK